MRLYSSCFKLHLCWLRLLSRITDFSRLIGLARLPPQCNSNHVEYIAEVWPRGSGPERQNSLVVMGVVLAGEGHLHARAAERAVADGDLAVVLLDDFRRHR